MQEMPFPLENTSTAKEKQRVNFDCQNVNSRANFVFYRVLV